MNDRDNPPKTHEAGKQLLLLVLNWLMCAGVPFATATAAPASVGHRVVFGKPMAMGLLVTAVLVASTVPPGGHLILGGYLFLAVIRHRVFRGDGVHSMSVGEPAIGGSWGRVLLALAAAGGGYLLLDDPRWRGPGQALILAAVGQTVLLGYLNGRRNALDQDAEDARIQAEAMVGRLRQS